MAFVTSTKNKNKNTGINAVFKIDTKGEEERINTHYLVNLIDAELKANQEFLDKGYINEVVEFETIFTDVKINDVIKVSAPTYRIPKELDKDLFLVKGVTHYFKLGEFKTKIKALRYEL